MFLRTFVIGRFGIPKYGDDEEHPLKHHEVEVLRKRFPQMRCQYPELLFFRLLNPYLFKNSRRMLAVLDRFDRALYRMFPPLGKYTYYQVIEIAR